MNKKLLICVITVMAVMCVFTACAYAATISGYCGDTSTWTVDTSTNILTISGTGQVWVKDINIIIDDYSPIYDTSKVTKVIVSKGITDLAPGLFHGFTGLKTVEFEEGIQLETLSTQLFFSTALEEITIPASVVSIDSLAFLGIETLKNVYFESGSKLKLIDDGVFVNSAVEKICIPASVTEIGEEAFLGCMDLKEITFENGSELKTIGKHAFYGSHIAELVIPASVTSIGESAFGNSSALREVVFETGSRIGKFDSIWFKRSKLTRVVMPDGVTSIAQADLANIKDTVEKIEFTDTSKLTSVGDDTFGGMPKIRKIVLPVTLKTVGKNAFAGCEKLEHVYFAPNGRLESIEAETAFINCPELISVRLPDSNTYTIDTTKDIFDGSNEDAYICSTNASVKAYCKSTGAANHYWQSKNAEPYTESDATCEAHGYERYICPECGRSHDDIIAATGHDWQEDTANTGNSAATCTDDGVQWYTCGNCSDTKQEVIKATGHDLSNGEITPATCSATGKIEYKCKNCAYTSAIVLPVTGHSWDMGVMTTEPTCTEEGEKTYTCAYSDCTVKTKTEKIPAAGHKLVKGDITPATCSTKGKIEYKCANCTYTEEDELPIVAHDWDNGVITTDPTCTEEGEKTYTCAYADCAVKTKTEKIEAKGHNYQLAELRQPTCGKDGEIVSECAACGDRKSVPIAKTGIHTWDSGVITKEPTKEAEGEKTYTCVICSETKKEPIARLDKYISAEKVEIKIHDSTMYLRKSKDVTQQLELKITPENADIDSIEWTSADENQARVSSDGIVTAKAKGKCRITVTVIDKNGSKTTDSAIISIKKKTGKVKKISFIDENGETVKKFKLKVGDRIEEPLKFKPLHIYDDRVKYSFSKKGIVKIENGALIAVKKGKTVLTVKSKNNKKVTAKLTITVK